MSKGGAGLQASKKKVLKETQKWDREADVVIIGSGAAGMCAAIEAAEAGSKVIVIEKEGHPGGHSVLCGGHMIVAGTHVQKRMGIEDKPDWLYEDMIRNSEGRAVPELVRTYVDKAPQHLLWLEQLGLKWKDEMRVNAGQRVLRGHWPAPSPDYVGGRPASGGICHMTVLFRAAEKRGVPSLLQHRMSRLIRPDRKGPVTGVEVIADGRTLNFKANKAVVIATGGFMANAQMCMAEDPRLTPDIGASGLPYVALVGDGHMAALDVGAGLREMSYVCFLPIKWGSKVYQVWEPPTMQTVPESDTGVVIGNFQRVIVVKNDGKRYVNEALATVDAGPVAYPDIKYPSGDYPANLFHEAFLNLKERPRNVWAVTDAEGAKALEWPADQMAKPNPKKWPGLYPDAVAVADTVKELAAKAGLDPAGLEATVARYNGFAAAGKDDDFGKPNPSGPIAKAPFFGAKLCMLRHTQRNGIRVNTKAQVLDRSDLLSAQGVSIDKEKTIPHLYAAGECAAGYYGFYHVHGTLGIYMVYGRIAGQNAAAEKPWG